MTMDSALRQTVALQRALLTLVHVAVIATSTVRAPSKNASDGRRPPLGGPVHVGPVWDPRRRALRCAWSDWAHRMRCTGDVGFDSGAPGAPSVTTAPTDPGSMATTLQRPAYQSYNPSSGPARAPTPWLLAGDGGEQATALTVAAPALPLPPPSASHAAPVTPGAASLTAAAEQLRGDALAEGQARAAGYHAPACSARRSAARFRLLQHVAPWARQEARFIRSPLLNHELAAESWPNASSASGRGGSSGGNGGGVGSGGRRGPGGGGRATGRAEAVYVRNEKVASTMLFDQAQVLSACVGAGPCAWGRAGDGEATV